jgi:two-component system CheB/CheR fusion protein
VTREPGRGVPTAIVGLGASAGGLAALEQFFAHVPAAGGAAFVVVQHLAPEHHGMLAELLQRVTDLPVTEIVDGTEVESDHVYVVPPGHGVIVRDEALHLVLPTEGRAPSLPIDGFFRSLAVDQRERAVCVVFSGMGNDGESGASAINERSGAVFAQDPTTAEFGAMPSAVIASGVCRGIAPPDQLARLVTEHIDARPSDLDGSEDDAGIDSVIQTLRVRTGHDFSLYKRATLVRRIERRMAVHRIDNTLGYALHLRENPQEVELLFKEILIGVTSFFRDPAVWEQLRGEVFPQLIEQCGEHGDIRVWSAGCSTGEEAYSLAMTFLEAVDAHHAPTSCSIQIFASDLEAEAIERARIGEYPASIAADVSPERLARFFEPVGTGYRISPALRKLVVFATHNVLMDPPFSKLDLIVCRNLLIYLRGNAQRQLIPMFHRCLRQNGVLVLGLAESVGTTEASFAELPGHTRIFRRTISNQSNREDAQSLFAATERRAFTPPTSATAPPSALQALADHLVLTRHGPAAVLTTDQGDIVYFSGRTGAFLEPAAGKANLNVFAMARDGIQLALHQAFTSAVRDQTEIRVDRLPLADPNGTTLVDLVVQPINHPPELRGMVLVVFTTSDVRWPTPDEPSNASVDHGFSSDDRLTAMSDELLRLRAELQSATYDAQHSRERLQSTIEELQSTNEELTTSQEEMQSINEELQTVNNELQRRVAALSRASDDMANLISSSSIATLYLDRELRVRRFTSGTVGLFNLIPSDEGRPIVDLASTLDLGQLVADTRGVMTTRVSNERIMGTADGRWFTVRVMPYRTQDDQLDGVVITFLDSTVAHTAAATRDRTLAILRGDAADAPDTAEGRIAIATELLSAFAPTVDPDAGNEP